MCKESELAKFFRIHFFVFFFVIFVSFCFPTQQSPRLKSCWQKLNCSAAGTKSNISSAAEQLLSRIAVTMMRVTKSARGEQQVRCKVSEQVSSRKEMTVTSCRVSDTVPFHFPAASRPMLRRCTLMLVPMWTVGPRSIVTTRGGLNSHSG